ncbi:MAG: hypothetical protein IT372_42655 [Polyangiaceae bacterium]|nr:hypothetical protein [Polyangiaceae bacterium]
MYRRVEALQKDGRDEEANEVAETYIDKAVAYPPDNVLAELCARYPLLRATLLEQLTALGKAGAEAAGKGG